MVIRIRRHTQLSKPAAVVVEPVYRIKLTVEMHPVLLDLRQKKREQLKVSVVRSNLETFSHRNIAPWAAQMPHSVAVGKQIGVLRKDKPRNQYLPSDGSISNSLAAVEFSSLGNQRNPSSPVPAFGDAFDRYITGKQPVAIPEDESRGLFEFTRRKSKSRGLREGSIQQPVLHKLLRRQRLGSAASAIRLDTNLSEHQFPDRKRTRASSMLLPIADRVSPAYLATFLKSDFTPFLIDRLSDILIQCGVTSTKDPLTVEQSILVMTLLYGDIRLDSWLSSATLIQSAEVLHTTPTNVRGFCEYLLGSSWREVFCDKWLPQIPSRCPAGHAMYGMKPGIGMNKTGKPRHSCVLCTKLCFENIIRCSQCDYDLCSTCRVPTYSIVSGLFPSHVTSLGRNITLVSQTTEKISVPKLSAGARPTVTPNNTPGPSDVVFGVSLLQNAREALISLYVEKPGDLLDELLFHFGHRPNDDSMSPTFNEYNCLYNMIEIWTGDAWYGKNSLALFAATFVTQSGHDIDRFQGISGSPEPYSHSSTDWSEYEPLNENPRESLYRAMNQMLQIKSTQDLDLALEAIGPWVKTIMSLVAISVPYDGTLAIPVSKNPSLGGSSSNTVFGWCGPVFCTTDAAVLFPHSIQLKTYGEARVLPVLNANSKSNVLSPFTCFTVDSSITVDGGSLTDVTCRNHITFPRSFISRVMNSVENSTARLKAIPKTGVLYRYIGTPVVEPSEKYSLPATSQKPKLYQNGEVMLTVSTE